MLDFPDSMWLESLEGNHRFNEHLKVFGGLKNLRLFVFYPYVWNPCRTLLQSPPQPWPQRQVTKHWMTAVQYYQYSSCMLWKEDFWINFPGQKLQWIYLHCLGSTVTVLTSHEYLKKEKIPNQILLIWAETWRDFQDFLAINNIMYIW